MSDFEKFEDMFSGGEEKLHEQRRKFKIEEIGDELPEFETKIETSIGENGETITEETSPIYLVHCGHITSFGPKEIKGRCSCGRYLCVRCANTRCYRCFRLLCNECAVHLDVPVSISRGDGTEMIVNQREVFCRKCRNLELAKRAGGSILRGLHRFLSAGVSE